MNKRLILIGLVIILLIILSFAVVKKLFVALLFAVGAAILIATFKIRENYSILTEQAAGALSQIDNETCAPFVRLGGSAPDIVRQQRLKKYKQDPSLCYIKLKDTLFGPDRNPGTACSVRNPQLLNAAHSNLVSTIYAGRVEDDDGKELTSDNVCFVRFNKDALDKPNTLVQLQSYAQYVSSRDPTILRLSDNVSNLNQRNSSLLTQVNTLNSNLGQARLQAQRANAEVSSLQNQLKVAQSTAQTAMSASIASPQSLLNPMVWLSANNVQADPQGLVAIWQNRAGNGIQAFGNAAGSSTLPKLVAENGQRFVRLQRSSDNGGGSFFNLGRQRFTNAGFTMITQVRWNNPPGMWERLIDFGSGPENNNLVVARLGDTQNYWIGFFNGTHPLQMNQNLPLISTGSWEWLVIVFENGKISVGNRKSPMVSMSMNNFSFNERVLDNCFIGLSHWNGDANANLDISQLVLWDRALSPNEIDQVFSVI